MLTVWFLLQQLPLVTARTRPDLNYITADLFTSQVLCHKAFSSWSCQARLRAKFSPVCQSSGISVSCVVKQAFWADSWTWFWMETTFQLLFFQHENVFVCLRCPHIRNIFESLFSPSADVLKMKLDQSSFSVVISFYWDMELTWLGVKDQRVVLGLCYSDWEYWTFHPHCTNCGKFC